MSTNKFLAVGKSIQLQDGTYATHLMNLDGEFTQCFLSQDPLGKTTQTLAVGFTGDYSNIKKFEQYTQCVDYTDQMEDVQVGPIAVNCDDNTFTAFGVHATMLESLRRKRTDWEDEGKDRNHVIGVVVCGEPLFFMRKPTTSKSGKFLHVELAFELVNKFLTADKLEAVRFNEEEANELVTALQIVHIDNKRDLNTLSYRYTQMIADQVNKTVRSFSI